MNPSPHLNEHAHRNSRRDEHPHRDERHAEYTDHLRQQSLIDQRSHNGHQGSKRRTNRGPGQSDRLDGLLRAHDGALLSSDLDDSDKRRLLRWAKERRLVRLMRGVYVARAAPSLVVRAVARAYPDAIFVGATAAWLNGQSTKAPKRIEAAHLGRSHRFTHFRLIRRAVPAEHWVESDGLRRTTPAMTAVDVSPIQGPGLIDAFMRTARDTAAALREITSSLTATPYRVGNRLRQTVVNRTTTIPWSELERMLHDLFDNAGIRGWAANEPLVIDGERLHPDARFDDERLVVEADGFAFHSDRHSFIQDRRRQNRLLLAGWRVLRFTWDDLTTRPQEVVAEVKAALAL